jgi:hypothetical protein
LQDPPNIRHVEGGFAFCGSCKWFTGPSDWCRLYHIGAFYHDLCDSWQGRV